MKKVFSYNASVFFPNYHVTTTEKNIEFSLKPLYCGSYLFVHLMDSCIVYFAIIYGSFNFEDETTVRLGHYIMSLCNDVHDRIKMQT